jgi:ferredoxin, 2Fe-2S
MTQFVFEHQGQEYQVTGENGESVMITAARHRVPGIDADCGGGCSCATCHVYLPQSLEVPQASDIELDMLDFAEQLTDESRLSCQVVVTPALEGSRIVIPG